MSVAFKSTAVLSSRAPNHDDEIVATDGELLMRFVRHRDNGAFAQIVERHGQLVWMICRQVLRHHQDVEDAFQATFLILAERARSIRASDSAAAWLFKVAQRTAMAARRKRSRRREESLVDEPLVVEESARAIDSREMLYILMQEIQNLPDRYQTPLVMRYLEGQSRRSIAEQTDSTVGQIQGRLVRGRRILRSRFLRRGASLSLATGAVATNAALADVEITAGLVDSTAETCLKVKTSGAASELSPAVLALVNEGVKAMWYASVAKCTAVVTAAVFTAGVVWAVQQSGDNGNGVAGPASPNGIALQVAAADRESTAPAVAAAPKTTRPAADAARQRQNYMHALEHQFNDRKGIMAAKMDVRSEKAAHLEVQQLEKAALQREYERLHEKLIEMDLAVGEQESKEAKQKLNNVRDNVERNLSSLKKELDELTLRTAKLSAELERRQFDVTRDQRRLDELDRLIMQSEIPQQPAPTTKAAPAAGGKLAPGDSIRIRVANAFADQPINDVYPVESMGTVALGPSYGRVKIAGLSILEAEEAVKKHFAEIIENPQVQVSEPPEPTNRIRTDASPAAAQNYPPATQNLEEVQRALEKIQTENAELKKKLEQKTPQSVIPR